MWLGFSVNESDFAPLVPRGKTGLKETTSIEELSSLCCKDSSFLLSFYNHIQNGFKLQGYSTKETYNVLLDCILDSINTKRKNGGYNPLIDNESRLFYSSLSRFNSILSEEPGQSKLNLNSATIDKYVSMYQRYSGKRFDYKSLKKY